MVVGLWLSIASGDGVAGGERTQAIAVGVAAVCGGDATVGAVLGA